MSIRPSIQSMGARSARNLRPVATKPGIVLRWSASEIDCSSPARSASSNVARSPVHLVAEPGARCRSTGSTPRGSSRACTPRRRSPTTRCAATFRRCRCLVGTDRPAHGTDRRTGDCRTRARRRGTRRRRATPTSSTIARADRDRVVVPSDGSGDGQQSGRERGRGAEERGNEECRAELTGDRVADRADDVVARLPHFGLRLRAVFVEHHDRIGDLAARHVRRRGRVGRARATPCCGAKSASRGSPPSSRASRLAVPAVMFDASTGAMTTSASTNPACARRDADRRRPHPRLLRRHRGRAEDAAEQPEAEAARRQRAGAAQPALRRRAGMRAQPTPRQGYAADRDGEPNRKMRLQSAYDDRADRQHAHDQRAGDRLPTPDHDQQQHREEQRSDQRAVEQHEPEVRPRSMPAPSAAGGSPPPARADRRPR